MSRRNQEENEELNLKKYQIPGKSNNSVTKFFNWECFVIDKKKSNKNTFNTNFSSLRPEFDKYPNKIIKQINREEIGLDKLKQSLKEVIAFKLIKIEELLYNYVDFYIKDKQLYFVLDFIDLVNKYHFKYIYQLNTNDLKFFNLK